MKDVFFRIIRKIAAFLFGYSYGHDIGTSYNRNFLLTQNCTGSRWVGKVSRSLAGKGVDFRDLNARALLAYRLAALVHHAVVAPRIISAKRISGFDVKSIPNRIDDLVFLTPVRGMAVPEYLKRGQLRDIGNIGDVYDNLVFNVWIGNYDRKDGDYLVGDDHAMRFIDYHLYGPGFRSDDGLSLGAYAEPYRLDDPHDTGWCIGGPALLQFVRDEQAPFDRFAPMIETIEGVGEERIRRVMKGLCFRDERNEEQMHDRFVDFLWTRSQRVRSAVTQWIEAGYPRGQRPKDPGREDHIYNTT